MRWLALLAVLGACGDDSSVAPDAAPDALRPATKGAWLAFDGLTLEPGEPDATMDTTDLVTATTTLPAFLASHPERAQILAGIAAEAQAVLAPYDIDVLVERPSIRYMTIAFAGTTGTSVATEHCEISSFADTIALQYERAPLPTSSDEIIHFYAQQTIAQIGVTYGVPEVITPGNCLCWRDAACAPGWTQQCSLGEAALEPRWPCRSHDPLDTADEMQLKLGLR